MSGTKIVKVAISALINGLLASVGAMLTLLASLEPGATLNSIGEVPVYIAIGTGLVTGLKDAQAALKNFED